MVNIINFHEITDVNWFRDIIEYLKKRYILIGTDELLHLFQSKDFSRNYCHLTIDDGHKSFYEYIFPVLRNSRIQASLFISPKICTEETNFWFQEVAGFNVKDFKIIIADYLKVELGIINKLSINAILKSIRLWQIKEIIGIYKKKYEICEQEFQNIPLKHLVEIHNSGLINIGSHTLNHPILANEDDLTSGYEITHSIKLLSEILNKKIDIFAFPNGIPRLDFGEREIKILKENNIKLAFSDVPGRICEETNLYMINRLGISYGNHNFVKAKIMMGPTWNKLKNIIIGGEEIDRIKLKRKHLLYLNSVEDRGI